MKRLTGVILALALLATILGGNAYAQTPANEVLADIRADWQYVVLNGDTFENGEVTGQVSWHTHVHNLGDESGADIVSLDVSLYSEQVFTHVQDELIEQMGPPNYEWYSFNNIPEWGNVGVYIGFGSPEEKPVTFTPGFDASRIFIDNRTSFLQLEGTQIQEVIVSLIPRDTTNVHVYIQTPPCQAAIVDAEIQAPSIDDYFELSPDGQVLSVSPEGLEIGKIWTATIQIAVTPTVPAIDFRPYVMFGPKPQSEPIPGEPVTGNSTQLDMTHMGETLGKFTWTADSDYSWDKIDYGVLKQVSWQPGCREIPLEVIPVAIDIKPGSCPNPINVISKGVMPVAILGTEDFDVMMVDPASVKLYICDTGEVFPLRWALEDVTAPYTDDAMESVTPNPYACTVSGPDGYQDLTLKFSTREVVNTLLSEFQDGDVLKLRLTGKLKEEYGGIPIMGSDVVLILVKPSR